MTDKIVVVTGASSGSGLGISRRFLQEGASVVMMARGKERLEQAAEELGAKAYPIQVDVGDPDSVAAAFEQVSLQFGQVDVLINNAAVYRPCAVELLSNLDITQQVTTNLLGPIYTSRAVIPLMRAAGAGDIINTSSESTLHPFPHLSMYVATKAALEAFGKVLAMEVAPIDIRVTTVIQGTAKGAGVGSTDWEWDPDHAAAAGALWDKLGLIPAVMGVREGQDVDDIGDIHLFIVTRPRTQKLDTVHARSF
ncbi:SDR family oxidoreductase [Acidiferrimicrobium sp. IK]|nr:SDR family oxidoreductase [Acidiferrimicrobium sp. IK]MCU4182897.1 SDR family oxidoreductase [Acidiferrimicrobium sp. IK]